MNEALDFIVCEIKINSLCSGGWSAVLYTGRSQVWPTLSSSTRECLCEHVAKDGHYEQISGLGHKLTLLPQMLCSEQGYHHEESQSGGWNWYMEKVRPKERQGNGAGALHCKTLDEIYLRNFQVRFIWDRFCLLSLGWIFCHLQPQIPSETVRWKKKRI